MNVANIDTGLKYAQHQNRPGVLQRLVSILCRYSVSFFNVFFIFDAFTKVEGREICTVQLHRKKVISEALGYGSHSCYTANTPCLPLPRKRSPDGTTIDSNSIHLIAAYYLFMDPQEDERLSWPS